ncbi:uncharacterized protein LOC136032958 [Artemia franciscana]
MNWIIIAAWLLAVVFADVDTGSGDFAEDERTFVCLEENSYCIPKLLCPSLSVSYDYLAQTKQDPSQEKGNAACGAIAATQNYVCCHNWDKMQEYSWVPSEFDWYLNSSSVDDQKGQDPYLLWPGFLGGSVRTDRRIGDRKGYDEDFVKFDGRFYSDQSKPQEEQKTEEPEKPLEEGIHDEFEWVMLQPKIPVANPYWNDFAPLLRFFFPPHSPNPRSPWMHFLPPGHFHEEIVPAPPSIPLVEDRHIYEPVPIHEPDDAHDWLQPYHYSVASSQIQIGDRIFSKTRFQENDKVRHEMTFY